LVEKLTDTCVGEPCVSTNVPVLHDPELVEVVQGANPTGEMMLSRSKIAGPPGIVRLTVLKAVMGKAVPMSLIVPVVPKIGSVPDAIIGVGPPGHPGATPENAIHGVLLDTDTRSPTALATLTTPPPPPTGIGDACATVRTLRATVRKPPAFARTLEFIYFFPP
jgi:hypothetical protein